MCRVSQTKFLLDKYIAGLCFYRTAFTAQKSGLKSSVFHSKLFSQISPKSYRHSAVPNRFSSHFSTSRTNGLHLLSRVKAGTHSAFGEGSHTAAYTPKQGPSERGRYHYPRSVPHVLETLRGQMSERQTLPLLGLGRGCSQRTQKAFGTAMRLCASLFRGVAAPLGCVIFSVSVEIAACMPCSRYFFRFSRRSSLCRSCASCVSARSFSARSSMGFGRNRQDFLL